MEVYLSRRLTSDRQADQRGETMLLEDSDFEKKYTVARLKQPRLMSVVTSMAIAMAMAMNPAIAMAADLRVLLLEPQPADKSTKLSTDLRSLVAKTLSDYVGRSGGYMVVRLPQGPVNGCEALDLGCVARSSSSKVEFVLGSKLQVNADNTIYLTLTLLDTHNPEHVESQNVPFGAPGRKRELSQEESDQLATKIEGTVGTLLRTLNQGATVVPPPLPVKPIPTTVGGTKLTVEMDGRGSVQSEPPGLSCDQAECVFPGGSAGTISLVATPGRARTVSWSGMACLNSVLADPLRCQVEIAKDARIKVHFDRSLGRKVGAGVLLGLSVASLASGFALLGIQGQTVADGTQVYNTWKLGTLSLAMGSAFGAASGLIYFF